VKAYRDAGWATPLEIAVQAFAIVLVAVVVLVVVAVLVVREKT
jgi:hypothetical protein